MPTLEFGVEVLSRLVGVDLDRERLEELFFNFKGEVEGWGDGTVVVELSSDRPDLYSASGLARAFRGFLGLEEGVPGYLVGAEPAGDTPTLRVEGWVEVRPYIDAYYVWGVSLDEDAVRDIIGLQEQLHASLSRGRRKFAIGVHDVSRLSTLRLVYRGVPPSEIRFTPLNETRTMSGEEVLRETEKGREYAHLLAGASRFPLLCTEAGEVLSMPPIINSTLTRVDASTRRVLVDVTGLEQGIVEAVAQLVASNIAEYGGRLCRVRVETDGWRPTQGYSRRLTLGLDEVCGLLGLELDAERVAGLLARARLGARVVDPSKIEVEVPLYRLDVLHPVDLVEDVAIMYGYEKIAPELPKRFTVGGYHALSLVMRAARNSLSTLGFVETNNLALTSSRLLERLGFRDYVLLGNPWSEELDALRPSLVPGLLAQLVKNQNKPKPIRVFEVGQVGLKVGGVYVQRLNAAAAICDNVATADQIESYFDRFMEDLGLKPSYSKCGLGFLMEGRRATIVIGGWEAGFIGEVSPETLRWLGLDYPVALFEVTVYTPTFKGLTFK